MTLIPEQFKLLRDKKYILEKVSKIVLENTEDNHYKYYHISQIKDQDSYKVAWGRIGSSAQYKSYSHREKPLFDQMCAKLKKGYQIKLYKTFDDHSAAYEEFMELIGGDVELFD